MGGNVEELWRKRIYGKDECGVEESAFISLNARSTDFLCFILPSNKHRQDNAFL